LEDQTLVVTYVGKNHMVLKNAFEEMVLQGLFIPNEPYH
jgi:hypothetical protein